LAVSEPLADRGREIQAGLESARGPCHCSRAPHRWSPGYRWFSVPRTRGELIVSGVDTLWPDYVLAVLMFGAHLWFTERTGGWGVVLGTV
jgi:hypothetical protein